MNRIAKASSSAIVMARLSGMSATSGGGWRAGPWVRGGAPIERVTLHLLRAVSAGRTTRIRPNTGRFDFNPSSEQWRRVGTTRVT